MTDNKNILPLSKPWEFAIPHQNLPSSLVSLRAKDCGVCHVSHYNEWKRSTHAQAWKDPQFQAELKKESSPFMCINCHIPLQNQQKYIIKGLEDGDIYKPVKEENINFDADLQEEGITCASCHVRDNAVIGPSGSTLAPHPVVKNTQHLSESLCISCHNANAVVTPTLACSFETGAEWKAGPFFGKKNCINCHMPDTIRSVVSGYKPRSSRFHSFPASGIPKFSSIIPDRLESLTFIESRMKTSYKIQDTLHYSLTLTNKNAGHKVPTGNPERFILIIYHLKRLDGKLLRSDTSRIGEQWEWHPEAKKLSDNNLKPGESRLFPFYESLKDVGKYTLDIKVSKHRMNLETAAYNKLGSEYPIHIDVFSKTYNIQVTDDRSQ
jgi:hypothetical protein